MRALPTILLVGASSQLYPAIKQALQRKYNVVSTSRQATCVEGEQTHTFDEAAGTFTPPLSTMPVAIISLAPLPVISTVLAMAAATDCHRVIAFGSASVLSKAKSDAPIEQDFVAQQLSAEQRLKGAEGIKWTLLRPTMIYGAGSDLNVARLRDAMTKYRVFPLPIGGTGLRQPVHVVDLAQACLGALESDAAINRTYDIGGGERLSYRRMLRRIAAQVPGPVLLLPCPLWLYRWGVTMLGRLPRWRYVRVAMVDRMQQDLVVDNTPVEEELGYRPGLFRPGEQRTA